MQTSKSATFTIRLNSTLLHELLQRVAARAYQKGLEDGRTGREPDEEALRIDPTLLRSFT